MNQAKVNEDPNAKIIRGKRDMLCELCNGYHIYFLKLAASFNADVLILPNVFLKNSVEA